jgi:tetratricopeptide (TPR) repeat protein
MGAQAGKLNGTESQEEVICRMRQYLEQEVVCPLLVYDNVDSEFELRELASCLPRTGCSILVTSRQQFGWQDHLSMDGESVIRLDSLDSDTAKRMFLFLVPSSTAKQDEKDGSVLEQLVCVRLQGLPLAIAQAAAYIRETATSMSEYLRLVEQPTSDSILFRDVTGGLNHDPVGITFQASIGKLRHAHSLKILRFCACMGADGIPSSLVQDWFQKQLANTKPSPSGSAPSKPIVSTTSGVEWAECLHEVVHFSLLSVSANNNNSIFMHRLVQSIVQQLYPVDTAFERGLSATLCKHLAYEDSAWPVSHRRQVLIHASAFLSLQQLHDSSHDTLFDTPRSRLLESAARCCVGELREPARAQAWLNELYTTAERHDRDSPFMERILSGLAIAHGDLGDPRSKKSLLERALVIKEKHYGQEHWRVAEILFNLANAHCHLGDPRTAKSLLERTLAIREKHYGPDHWHVAATLTSLACTLGTLGDPHSKKTLLERALVIKEKHYGPNHWQVAITLTNLAVAYGTLGDLRTKKSLLERALDINEKHYGPNHWQVAINLWNLAEVHGALGDHRLKVTLLERVVASYEAHYGSTHPKTIKARNALSAAKSALTRTACISM